MEGDYKRHERDCQILTTDNFKIINNIINEEKMRNLNNVEINAVAGGEKCTIEVWKNGVPRFSLVVAAKVDGRDIDPTNAEEMKMLVNSFQKTFMKGEPNAKLQTTGSDKSSYHFVAICQNDMVLAA